MKQRRDKQVNVRLTADEAETFALLSEQTGQSVSALLRATARVAFGVPSAEEANIRRFDEILGQLSRVGNNLNQLARRANQGHLVMSAGQGEVLERTAAQVSELYGALIEYKRLAGERDFASRIEDLRL